MLVLVRHAESHPPTPGGPDELHRGLTPAGRAQAEDLVAELAALGPTRIVSSPYARAVQTVRPLARALGRPVETYPDLREWDSGIGPRPDWAEQYAAAWAEPDRARPGGESLAALSRRALAALAAVDVPGTVVVGSHGTFVARALVGLGVAGIDWDFARAMPMPAVYRLGGRVTGPGG